jgi:hypothetical protein
MLREGSASRAGGSRFWFGLTIFVVGLNLYTPAPITAYERILASAIIIVAFTAIWNWMNRGKGEPNFGFLPVVMIVFTLEYAVPVFTLKAYSLDILGIGQLDHSAVEKALLLSLLGLVCILVGYYYPGRRMLARRLPKVQLEWKNQRAAEVASVVLGGIGILAFALTYQVALPLNIKAYVLRAGDFFYLSAITLLVLQLTGRLDWGLKFVLWGVLIPLRALLGLAQGHLALGMLVVMALVIAYATIRRRIPWVVFIIGFGAFFIMQPVKAEMRKFVWVGGGSNKSESSIEKIEHLYDSIQLGMDVMNRLGFEDILSIASYRLADIMVFATVTSWTPQKIPYWGGETYYDLLVMPIPRLLYPEKPYDIPGNLLGHRYRILDPRDYTTSINLPQLTELYGNFGCLGLILGSILTGMLYRTINDLFLHPACGLGSLVVGAYLLTMVVDIENAASVVFGALFIQVFVSLFFHLAVRFSERALATRNYRRVEPVLASD